MGHSFAVGLQASIAHDLVVLRSVSDTDSHHTTWFLELNAGSALDHAFVIKPPLANFAATHLNTLCACSLYYEFTSLHCAYAAWFNYRESPSINVHMHGKYM